MNVVHRNIYQIYHFKIVHKTGVEINFNKLLHNIKHVAEIERQDGLDN